MNNDNEYETHYEIDSGYLVLVVRICMTSNFPVCKRIWIEPIEDYFNKQIINI